MVPFLRRWRVVLLAGAVVVLLTGCVKLDVDLTVGGNDKVSGTYIIGIDRSLLQLTGQDADSLYQQLSGDFDTASLPEGASATAEKYDQDNFVGAKVIVTDLPIASLNGLNGDTAQTSSSQFSLSHEGDEYQFHATIDTSSSGDSAISVPESLTSSAEIRVRMTFPGEVVETNGSKDGTSVTWEPKLGDAADLTATAKDSGGATGSDSSITWLVVLAIVAGLAVVVVLLVFLIARSRREGAPPPPNPPVPQGPPPGLGSLAPPAALAAPRPPIPDPAPPPSAAPGSPLPPPSSR